MIGLTRLVLSAGALTLGGCATLVHGTTQDVGLTSSPTAAQVWVDNKPLGTTPLLAPLTRRDDHVVRFALDGYQPFDATLTRRVSGWVWGNIFLGIVTGLAVDAISGAIFKLEPKEIAAQLQTTGELCTDCVYLFVVLEPDPTWTRIGSIRRQ